MKRWLGAVLFILFLAVPVLVKAEEKLYSDVSFRVRSIDVLHDNNGVWVEFKFYESEDIKKLVVSTSMLGIEVGRSKGTVLVATYKRNCTMLLISCSEKILKATLFVSQKSVKDLWQKKIGEVTSEYEKLRDEDIVPK